MNKGEKYGKNIYDVILRKAQYSCFNEKDKNIKKIMASKKQDLENWNKCYEVARKVLEGEVSDPTNGATHYFNPRTANPSWKHRLVRTAKIDNHEFYRL